MGVAINITRPDVYSIRINPAVAMSPGEYAFVDKTTAKVDCNMTVWAFGIE